jgi:hypothetical protein
MESRIKEVHSHEMREQVIDIIIDALTRQGYPTLDRKSVRENETHRSAMLEMLKDCRPLPVIEDVKRDLREGRF